jgi:hypothetical protein
MATGLGYARLQAFLHQYDETTGAVATGTGGA